MALHKMVNGVKIDLTPAEEKAILAEWSYNEMKEREAKEALANKERRKAELKSDVMAKLGLTEEEMNILMG